MTTRVNFEPFLEFWEQLSGDEKGEAQVFLDWLFRAFGHEGFIQAGAVPEARSRKKGGRRAFLDLHWPGRVLIEMKKRGERLERHYDQAVDYWGHIVPVRPRYIILCNFDEIWVYEPAVQNLDPVDKIQVADLASRWMALAFLLPEEGRPLFQNNLVEVTRKAANSIAGVFNSMVNRRQRRVT